jgi:predicted nicotinamide N-methyase
MDSQHSPAPPPETIWDQLGPLVREKVIVEGEDFFLDRPGDSDKLMDHPAVHRAFAKDEYLPYWTDLWPASRMLAKVIHRETWTPGTEALEIGCGLGLPGIVALSRGLKVTFSDYDECALRFAAANARLNGFENFRCLQMDWRFPPEGLQVPVLLAADLIYEMRNVKPIVVLIRKILHPEGICLLTDQDRIPSHALRESLQEEGLHFTTQIVRAGEPNGRRLKGTLYRVSLAVG